MKIVQTRLINVFFYDALKGTAFVSSKSGMPISRLHPLTLYPINNVKGSVRQKMKWGIGLMK